MATTIQTLPAVVTGTGIVSTWGNAASASVAQLQTPPYCWVYNNSGISVLTSTFTLMTFDAESDDAFAMHSTVTNTSRVTPNITQSGRVNIKVRCRIAASGTGFRALNLRRNAAGSQSSGTSLGQFSFPAISGTAAFMYLDWDYDYTPGDYYECWVWQNSGGTLVTETGNSVTSMQVEWRSL